MYDFPTQIQAVINVIAGFLIMKNWWEKNLRVSIFCCFPLMIWRWGHGVATILWQLINPPKDLDLCSSYPVFNFKDPDNKWQCPRFNFKDFTYFYLLISFDDFRVWVPDFVLKLNFGVLERKREGARAREGFEKGRLREETEGERGSFWAWEGFKRRKGFDKEISGEMVRGESESGFWQGHWGMTLKSDEIMKLPQFQKCNGFGRLHFPCFMYKNP